ncbi:lipoprotein [Hydrogenophaga sp.]|uniref:LPS translocon maturation chaperone LptM n=1 Tax=Hydrogenophaga sp. TaxID=1904254 RepID=UPI00345935CA
MLRTTRILGRRHSLTRGMAMALGVFMLSACGQKGPLYLPTASPTPVVVNPAATNAATQSDPTPR